MSPPAASLEQGGLKGSLEAFSTSLGIPAALSIGVLCPDRTQPCV